MHAQVWHECASLFGLSRFSALHTLDVSSAAKIAFEFCSLHFLSSKPRSSSIAELLLSIASSHRPSMRIALCLLRFMPRVKWMMHFCH